MITALIILVCNALAETGRSDQHGKVSTEIQAMEDAYTAKKNYRCSTLQLFITTKMPSSYSRNKEPLVGKAVIRYNVAKK